MPSVTISRPPLAPPSDAGASGYVERLPALGAVAGVVSRVWTRAPAPDAAGRRLHRVLPDGCSDLLLELAPGEPPALTVVGAMTRPVVVAARADALMIGVRLRSGHAFAALGVAASAMADLRVPVADLWPDAAPLTDALGAAAEDDPTPAALGAALERLLAARVAAAAPPADVVAAVRLTFRSRGRLTVDALAAHLGVTRQHLARRFARHVGVTPKTLGRVARVRHVLRLARGAAEPDWSRIAYEAGYCDQSHLIADFGALTGVTPTRWAAAR